MPFQIIFQYLHPDQMRILVFFPEIAWATILPISALDDGLVFSVEIPLGSFSTYVHYTNSLV